MVNFIIKSSKGLGHYNLKSQTQKLLKSKNYNQDHLHDREEKI